MNILLTNDDGIHAPGLKALYKSLSTENRVFIVAPETEQSAVGHAITLTDPIRVKEIHNNDQLFGYAISGTPADCVKIALADLLEVKPDAVVSGINLGANVGINLLYSGTVSAATEATILGLPAIAVSLDTFTNPDFTYAADFIRRLIKTLPSLDLAPRVCLNVNVPSLPQSQIKGVVWVKQYQAGFKENFFRRLDPRGNVYYWQGGEKPSSNLDPDSDMSLLAQKMITITPLKYDLTNHRELDRLSGYRIEP
ncbi:MAG: 5'/3'-nucleotidase SurE [Deltaproteobacteria bacterium]|nr:5'/3'-nucleotidase SurE [Deltaproteobacteria bacterium]MBW2053558.1 5'/3'-nucleotidase SurE [Deltaproteobacteria bacterium]MBW2142101.1 5'/3'-nucleotidase SurE [Deltaproteobacteria bacterium]